MKSLWLAGALAALGILASGCADLTYDATPPTVALVYPVAWCTLEQDTVEVRADAYDNQELELVAFFVNGESLATVTAFPYHATWLPETTGCYTVYCVAQDAAGNETHTTPINVTIIDQGEQPDREPPGVALVRPASWSVVSDTVSIEAIAWDNRGVDWLLFFLDGDTLARLEGEPWVHRWNSRSVGNGPHTVFAVAADSSDNRAYSVVITIDVQNAP